jgi:hypothetical protein
VAQRPDGRGASLPPLLLTARTPTPRPCPLSLPPRSADTDLRHIDLRHIAPVIPALFSLAPRLVDYRRPPSLYSLLSTSRRVGRAIVARLRGRQGEGRGASKVTESEGRQKMDGKTRGERGRWTLAMMRSAKTIFSMRYVWIWSFRYSLPSFTERLAGKCAILLFSHLCVSYATCPTQAPVCMPSQAPVCMPRVPSCS